jgi:hypothetical protein
MLISSGFLRWPGGPEIAAICGDFPGVSALVPKRVLHRGGAGRAAAFLRGE